MMVGTNVLLIFAIGLLAGAYGIIVGAGGGFILVPAFLIILNLHPAIAVGTGLVVVCINALSGGWSYIIQRRINYKLALYLIIGAIPGSYIGIVLTQYVSPNLFEKVFASMLFILGLFLFWKNGQEEQGATYNKIEVTTHIKWSIIIVGILMGIISSFFGIGGGWLLVPILIYIYRVSPHFATATSVFTLCVYSLVGSGLHIYAGNVDWQVVLWSGAGALIGAQIGVFISNKISGKLIIQLLSFLLIAIGIKMFF